MSKIKQKQETLTKQNTEVLLIRSFNMKESLPKHSGFEAPTYGIAYPKGTKFKEMPDGTIKPVEYKDK